MEKLLKCCYYDTEVDFQDFPVKHHPDTAPAAVNAGRCFTETQFYHI
jgi:hypothetical protein